jgi:3D (Asp-Asp-Asp) domain-containing protein
VELTEKNQIEENNILMTFSRVEEDKPNLVKVIVTAYSSTVWQTNEDPFTTASGIHVKEGIVANNMLPFGTEIKIPEYFGDKVFIVEDRMNRRKGPYWVDIWFATTQEAVDFGIREAYIEILEI